MANRGEIRLNSRAIGLLIALLAMYFVIGPLIAKYSEMPGSPNLQFGQRVMYQMMGRENLEQVGFFESYPSALPSDFANMVADPGHQLWPPPPKKEVVGAGRDGSNRILMPPDVVFSARERRAPSSDEIVYTPDDAARKMVVRGYSPGEPAATFEYEWEFPTKAGRVPLD